MTTSYLTKSHSHHPHQNYHMNNAHPLLIHQITTCPLASWNNFKLDNQLNPSKEAQIWIHFTSFNLLSINIINDYSVAMIMGISTVIHSKRYVTKHGSSKNYSK